MAVPKHINSKFAAIIFEDIDGKIKARVSTSGTIQIVGLNVAQKVTEIEVNDSTWTELSGALFSTRNAMNIQNKSEDFPNGGGAIKVNGDDSQVGYVGMEVLEGDERDYDIRQVPIYAKSKSGTFKITIEEIA